MQWSEAWAAAVQVEHTVTEEVVAVDLVQAQIRIAGGATLADIGIGRQVRQMLRKPCAVKSLFPLQSIGNLALSPLDCQHALTNGIGQAPRQWPSSVMCQG